MSYFALRYFNACGATATRGERHEPETHLIPLVLDVAAGRREHVKILGDDYPTPDGTCIRDYVHVLDLADAHIAALQAPGELSGGYNVGSGRGDSVREVVETARRVTGREIPVVIAPRRPGDPPELVADPRKIQANLGWKPSHAGGRHPKRMGPPPAQRMTPDSVETARAFYDDYVAEHVLLPPQPARAQGLAAACAALLVLPGMALSGGAGSRIVAGY
ncbi:MAG: GDP-mannose 4,6-dehydratase [Bryobacterales bacterium]